VSPLSDAAMGRLREAASWPAFESRYVALGIVGQGGSATVYRARDEMLQRDVAVKVLDVPDLAGRAARRLAREAHILAHLDHPGIVPIHDYGVLEDGRSYFVMKLVDGSPLDEAASTRPLAERLSLFERVLETVAFAHDRGIIHRDLKPPNILVGTFGQVFVMDWGAAEAASFAEVDAAVVGTPGYMAPEQESGTAVDARTDVFALGTMLRELAGGAPQALLSIAMKATAAVPADRYASVQQMAEEIQAYRVGGIPGSYREPVMERLLRHYRRHELPVLLVAAYVVMRALLLIWSGI
jgi:serine/threonine protein kinase